MSFQFRPVVRTLSDLAKTIKGRLEVVRIKKSSGLGYLWAARVVGPTRCEVGYRVDSGTIGLFFTGTYGDTPELARKVLAQQMSNKTFVVRDLSGVEHTLPLGRIRP